MVIKNTLKKSLNTTSTTIGAQLYLTLRAAIIRGELSPGQALSESEIARQYATSRQPVREAFIKLAEERLLSIQSKRGTFVVKISVADVLDSRFVREAIEVALVQEVTLSASLATIGELRGLLAQQKALAAGHHAEFLALDEAFHQRIALAANRPQAWRVIENVKAQMDRVRYLSFDHATPIKLIVEQHTRIVDAIEAGDAGAAAAAMRTHLREITISLPTIAARLPAFFEAN